LDTREINESTEYVNPLARESESYYRFRGSELETLRKVWLEPVRGFLSDEFYFMPGIGALYSRVSSYIFGDWNKCGEVMGLAPYGRPDRQRSLIRLENGQLEIPQWTAEFDKPWFPEVDRDWEKSPSLPHWEDLAWRVQNDTESVLLDRARWLRETTGARNLCIAGGVGLNCVANGRIVREAGFDNVWIQPAAGDDGIAIGCAYYGYIEILKKPRAFVMDDAYLGIAYVGDAERKALNRWLVRLETSRTVSGDICIDSARLLAQGNVFGWFQGRSEFGPRALGNRSILADPRTAEMKDKLNKRVKHRQAFRPFAPVVLAERAGEIFEGDEESPFMLVAMHVRPAWKEKIPAVVHVDGTSRVQTVRERQNPRLHRLLREFEAITGVPVLVNTSFNVKGEPIVETPRDALDCFLTTGIDYVALHDSLISKTVLHRIFSPLMRASTEVASIVRSGMNAG
jgi:carbamoyltransferase